MQSFPIIAIILSAISGIAVPVIIYLSNKSLKEKDGLIAELRESQDLNLSRKISVEISSILTELKLIRSDSLHEKERTTSLERQVQSISEQQRLFAEKQFYPLRDQFQLYKHAQEIAMKDLVAEFRSSIKDLTNRFDNSDAYIETINNKLDEYFKNHDKYCPYNKSEKK